MCRFHPSPVTVPYTSCGIDFALTLLWADHYPDSGARTGSGRSIRWGQCSGGEKVQCSCSQEASRGKEPSLSANSAKPLLLVWTITSVIVQYNVIIPIYGYQLVLLAFNAIIYQQMQPRTVHVACLSFLLSTFTSCSTILVP